MKDSDKPLRDGCTNHSKLSAVAQVFTIKSDHGLSEVDYDEIIEWAKSISPEGNRLNKQNRVFLFKCYGMTPLTEESELILTMVWSKSTQKLDSVT